jgi:flagellar protein FlgJ
MLPPEIALRTVSAEFAQEAERIALPLDVGGAAGTSFPTLLHDVQSEISEFIANGSSAGSAGMSGSSLSAEGFALRARSQMSDDASGQGADIKVAGREQQEDFIASVAPWARVAANRLGVSRELLTAHAALESGWGQRPLRGADGTDAHNLFGIKAGRSWNGGTVNAPTTEVLAGAEVTERQDFRSYAGDADAFTDYASVLLDNPRFRGAINAGDNAQAFAHGLVQGKYATDPAYAHKLERVARQIHDMGPPQATAGIKADY